MDVDAETSGGGVERSTAGSSENSSEGHPGPTHPPRPARLSTPEFPYKPSPDVPPWLSKCLRLLTLRPEDAQAELGRMIDEALEKRERQAVEDTGIVPGGKKPDIRHHAGVHKVAPIPVKSVVPPLKIKMPAVSSEKVRVTTPVKRPRSPSPPVVKLADSEYTGTTVTIPDTADDGGQFSVMSSSDDTEQLLSDLFREDSNEPCCAKCSSFTNVEGNKLLTCETCHDSYHQLCVKPSVADIDANDPRLVWYCHVCEKKVSKTASAPASVNFSAKNAAIAKLKTGSNKNSTAAAAAAPPAPLLFQRQVETKPSTSIMQGGSTGGGLAGLAKLKTMGAQGLGGTRTDKPPPKRAKYLDSSKINLPLPKNA